MRTIAFTFIQNDMVILDLWVRYYSQYFDDLLVFCSATKPKYDQTLEEMNEKYGLQRVNLPADEYDATTANLLIKEKQKELLKDYTWVLYCNVDEYLVTDPDKYRDLKELMSKTRKRWVNCVGYEVLQEADEPVLDYSKPILRQRKSWLKNYQMNKVILSKIELDWEEGQHYVRGLHNGFESECLQDVGLLLVHLRHADLNATGRDFGPMKHGPYGFVKERFGSRIDIPERFKDLL